MQSKLVPCLPSAPIGGTLDNFDFVESSSVQNGRDPSPVQSEMVPSMSSFNTNFSMSVFTKTKEPSLNRTESRVE